ncbi:MAG: hypothetical protein DRJ11_08130 [Candidatus Aminicenantes bacterium]|nr:MAG: hypothetical protein DRJ11_08130 [Candidatus Aminicenantes bacterium]
MKNIKKYFSLFCILFFLPLVYSQEKIKLEQDFSIGENSGDENYIFGRISDIAISPKDEIFVLDTAKWVVSKFSRNGKFLLSVGKRGQGPGEFGTYPVAIETDNEGNLIVAEFRKISIFNNEGKFLGSFKLDFQCQDFFIDDSNWIILLGLKDGKIFHIYNRNGEEIFSFRKPVEIPQKYLKYKRLPNMNLPFKVYFTKNKRLIYMNPYKYELIIADKVNQIVKKIEHKSEFYKPAMVLESRRGKSLSVNLITMNYSIFEYKNFMYVCLFGENESQIDIFKNDKYFDSLKIKSFPKAMDNEGNLYAIDESDFPKILRYNLIIQ